MWYDHGVKMPFTEWARRREGKSVILAIVALCNVLLFVWTFQARLCLAGAKDGRVHPFPKGSRLILSFSIVLANFVIWCLELYTVHKLLIFTGMLFSFAGDLSMAGLLPWRNRLIGGMMTFGVAHCSYMAAFIAAAHANGTTVFNVCLLAAFCGYTGMLFFMWRAFIRNPKKTDLINRGALLYGLLVGGTASFALGAASVLRYGWVCAAIGGLLFVISDAVVAAVNIGEHSIKNKDVWIWITYIPAQAMIVYASVLPW